MDQCAADEIWCVSNLHAADGMIVMLRWAEGCEE